MADESSFDAIFSKPVKMLCKYILVLLYNNKFVTARYSYISAK